MPIRLSASMIEACHILFGPNVAVTEEFLAYLQEDGLKAAFRTRALETHPDRAEVLGVERGDLSDGFIKVTWAYEQLKAVVNQPILPPPRYQPPPRPAPPRPEPPRSRARRQAYTANAGERFYHGEVPRRVLRIGEFLYYTGQISWKTLIASLVWQKAQRPFFGQIAVEWNLIEPGDIARILRGKHRGEKFGEAAVRQGFIIQFWIQTILKRQARLQPLLGQFFIDQGILDQAGLESQLERLAGHNQRVVSQAW